MKSIDIMIQEHENIRRMLKVIRKYSYKVLLNEEIDYNDFYKIIDFIRNYSDKHHHMKEEKVLFKIMEENLPQFAKNGPITGMLIEHDIARLYILNLEKALGEYKEGNDEKRLDIIANSISYADLLNRHIDKENTALYKFAKKSLPCDSKDKIDEQSEKIEENASKKGIQHKYLKLLKELEDKVSLRE